MPRRLRLMPLRYAASPPGASMLRDATWRMHSCFMRAIDDAADAAAPCHADMLMLSFIEPPPRRHAITLLMRCFAAAACHMMLMLP